MCYVFYMYSQVVIEDRCDLKKWVVLAGSPIGGDGHKTQELLAEQIIIVRAFMFVSFKLDPSGK